jgi:hypothetical protein
MAHLEKDKVSAFDYAQYLFPQPNRMQDWVRTFLNELLRTAVYKSDERST